MHSLRDRKNPEILERKVDLAVRGEREAQQKLYQAEAEVEARKWESNVKIFLSNRSIKNLNLSDFSYIKLVDGQIWLRETKLPCMENWN